MNNFSLNISDQEKIIYLKNIKGKIFKILPLCENNNDIVPIIYLEGLMMDVNSSNQIFDGILIDLLIHLNTMRLNKLSHKQIRKIVLESIDIVSQLIKQIKERS